MVTEPVPVHSVAEAYLYLMVRSCPICDRGPVRSAGELTKTQTDTGPWEMPTRCSVCGEDQVLSFEIRPEPTPEQAGSNWINPTPDRSRAIDLLGWLTLFRSIISASQKESDKEETRRLALECAQCLDEALKFYEPDNEVPGDGAFFTEASRRRFRDHPQQFARSRWQHERSKLPTVVFRGLDKHPDEATPRWRFWKKRG